MGITPITNLIPLTIARFAKANLEPLPTERVESSARSGDETYSRGGDESDRGPEDDSSENGSVEDDPGELGENSASRSATRPNSSQPAHAINFFA